MALKSNQKSIKTDYALDSRMIFPSNFYVTGAVIHYCRLPVKS
jgi:hypothetical protein